METAELTREQVLKRDIPWETYLTAKLITGTGLQLLRRYDHKPENVQTTLLNEDGAAYIRVFVSILRDITKEETVEYVLALVDELLSIDPKRARLFHDKSIQSEDVYQPFLRLLSKKNWFIQEKSCKILTLVISTRPRNGEIIGTSNGTLKSPASSSSFEDVLQKFVDWLCSQLRQPSHPGRGIPTAVSSLATLLRDFKVRTMFVRADGVKLLAPLISPATSQQYIQLLYEAILCMWLLSFYDAAVDAIAATRAVPRLVEVAKSSIKEKVVRVTILTLKNLLPKGSLASDMVELGLPKVVQSLKLQAWSDEDLTQALDALEISLNDNIKLLSSFEKYKQELLSGNLDWTPVHRDGTFWRENIQKFEENNFQVLRILVTILDNSRDFKTLAVACHDLALFIQNHPAGRGIVLDLKAKDRVMKLMNHDNPEVRKEALLCVQRFLLSAKYASYLQ
ncbi:hypothetical protein O6H91_13G096900 [Diphasiastrum complanatum]|uniref:Uncharacterized protein n=5 Tax=Diphasiastrum complanatum TaxID=34168 RepID=A0ACC2BXI8_DIPCM|nr:hypothetical protein O6H91_13G096900 [Diphasiastrum complanatum]KAJ7534493.1 hypothetical protein O6H91_13G096900 [Diphasiastrum complanatum]KAJ7534494.1 hypothetical protein O6H91_13G096900 [Diphasiastrum complanatum]KAJ7534495.1 hypothetical protein O6H91_13G096900 [Diphasiastrum complanatum]KAJ7534496.1 hypothetical protein O6H91_13G096900 [Diphasiastrum complanatum]